MFVRHPTKTYTSTGAVILVPNQALALMWEGLSNYRKARVEGCCFWYGPNTDSKEMSVTHVVFPKQINNRRSFKVASDAIAEMSAATRPLRIINRAQIHTHPRRWTGHSLYDDDHAISRKAISIVLPYYGKPSDSWPEGFGFHVFQNEAWHLLTSRQASERVRLVEGEVKLIDLR